jgi:hypothetical protein
VSADALESFCLNLADALARDAKLFAYFFECMVNAVFEAMAEFQNLALLGRKLVQNFVELVAEDAARDFLIGRKDFVVFDEIAQGRLAVLFV